MTTAQTAVDIITQAHLQRELEALLDLMADDAQLIEYRMDDISTPQVTRGPDEIGVVLSDFMSRDMTHEITDVVATADKIAYTVHCAYPDGNRVLGSYMVDLDADGQITRVAGHVSWTS